MISRAGGAIGGIKRLCGKRDTSVSCSAVVGVLQKQEQRGRARNILKERGPEPLWLSQDEQRSRTSHDC